MSNAIQTSAGIEIYEHDIQIFADQYIAQELKLQEPLSIEDREVVNKNFTAMIMYIGDRIQKPSHDDIQLLDALFYIYVRLCCKYNRLPTLEIFSLLIKTSPNTLSDWSGGQYRGVTHSTTIKKWKDICKSFVIDRLTNKGGTDANLIFIAKAAYGMAETAPTVTINDRQTPTRTAAEIAAGRDLSMLPEPEKPEI